jgi:hypothetical protein
VILKKNIRAQKKKGRSLEIQNSFHDFVFKKHSLKSFQALFYFIYA